jgi:hypothetical protein
MAEMGKSEDSTGAFDFTEAANQLLGQSGYELRVNPFMEHWAKIARNFPGKKVLNPEFDPEKVQLNPTNSFWLELSRGETVATFAMRDLGTADLCETLTSYDLWGGSGQIIEAENTELLPRGRVTLEGACWIHPAHRGTGLAWLLPRIARALALQRSWSPDAFMGFIVNRPFEDGIQLALEKYGCAQMFKFADSFSYPFLPVQPLYLTVSDRDYVDHQLSVATRSLREYAHHKMGRDFVAFIRQGQQQPVEAGGRTVRSVFDALVRRAGEIGSRRPVDNNGFAEKRLVELDG